MNERTLLMGDTSVKVRLHRAAWLAPRAGGPLPPADLARAAGLAARALPRDARSVCLVVPDRTRDARLGVVLPPLLEALGARGLLREPPSCVFASGTHAPMSPEEMSAALGEAASQVRAIPHDCDASGLVTLASGARVHPAVARAEAILVVGTLSWHYLAGFGGGRKMLLPGVGDRAAATAIHRTSLVAEPAGRHPKAIPGVLEENPLHEAIVRLAEPLLARAAGLSVVVRGGRILDVEGGPLLAHHAAIAARFSAPRTVTRARAYDGVVLSCGGAPYDSDLVQAHKALFAIAPLVRERGRIAWLAALPRGHGHARMREWMTSMNAGAQLSRLLDDFVIGEQTAWSLRTLVSRFDVGLVSSLDDDEVRALGMTPLLPSAIASFVQGAGPRLAFAPEGAAYRYLRGSAPR